MTLGDYTRTQRVPTIGDVRRAVVYTGSRRVWEWLGKPAPYTPSVVATIPGGSCNDSVQHEYVVCADGGDDVPNVLHVLGTLNVQAIVCVDLCVADEVQVRSAALAREQGCLILRRKNEISSAGALLREIGAGRWPAADFGIAGGNVVIPPGSDSEVKIDAVRKAHRVCEAQVEPGAQLRPRGRERVISGDWVREDEKRWRAQLATAISSRTHTAPTQNKQNKRSSFFLKMLDQ